MSTHDCDKCSVENCPLRGIAPWLNEHETELQVATQETAQSLAQSCYHVVKGIAVPLYSTEVIANAVKSAFCLGYHKGRTYQDVPKVFKEG